MAKSKPSPGPNANRSLELSEIRGTLDQLEKRLRQILLKKNAGAQDMADAKSLLQKVSDLNTEVDSAVTRSAGAVSATDAQAIEDGLTAIIGKVKSLGAPPAA